MKNKNAILIALFLLAALMIGSVHASEDGLDSSINAIKDTSTSNEAIINSENTINSNDEAIGQAIANDENGIVDNAENDIVDNAENGIVDNAENEPKTIENQENDPSDNDESDEDELISNSHSSKAKLGAGVEFTDQTISLKANTQTIDANNPNAPVAYIRIPKSKTGTMYVLGISTIKLSDVKSKITKNGFTTYTIRLKDIKEPDIIFEEFNSGDHKKIDFKYKSSNGDICYEGREVILKINKKAKTFRLKQLINCEIYTSTYDIKSGRNKKYTIKLGIHSGKGIKGKILKVSINGVRYVKKTNSQGKIFIYPPKYLAPKQYQKVYTSFAGDDKYTGATLASDIQIYKNPKSSKSVIKAESKSFNANLGKSYQAKLLSKGKAIKNAKLTMTVGNDRFVAKTNSKGVATFNLNKLDKSGPYSGTIVYMGDKKHYMTYKNVKLFIVKNKNI